MKLVLALALSLFAQNANFYADACTKDHVVVTMRLIVDQSVLETHPLLPDHLKKAFLDTAAKMDVDALKSPGGFSVFMSNLDKDDQESLVDVYEPRVVEGASCKGSK